MAQIGAVFLTPFLIATIIAPTAMFYFFLGSASWSIPLEDIPLSASIMVWSLTAVFWGCTIFFWYMVYEGRKAHKDIHAEQGAHDSVL